MKYGDYIRTKTGKIRKIVDTVAQYYLIEGVTFDEKVNRNDIGYTAEDIVNHSKNIIDLIQVGDYVNGSYVVDILEDMQTGELHLEMTYNYTNQEKGDCTIYNKDIKEILTKEQFNQNVFKVVE